MRTTTQMGLSTWDQPLDTYNPAQFAGNWQIVDHHDHSPGRGVQLPAGALGPGAVLSSSIAAGVVGPQHLTPVLAQDLGVGATGRGAVSTAFAQTTTSTTPAWLATPDQVTGIVLNSNGLILVDFQALWKVTASTGSAYLSLNGTTVQSAAANNAFTNLTTVTTATHLSPLYTSGGGLTTLSSSTTDSSELTTGQAVGTGCVAIFAAPGTYTVGIQFSNAAGSTTQVQNRHLFVRSVNFQ